MKLVTATVHNYRNILDSTPIEIRGDVTCLVGKNESGKTAVLHALARLNPALGESFDANNDYPRWLAKRHRASGEAARTIPVTAVFELDDDNIAELEEQFGPGAVPQRAVTVTRSYDNGLGVRVAVDEAAIVRHLLAPIPGPKLTPVLGQITTVAALRHALAETEQLAGLEGADEELARQCTQAWAALVDVLGDADPSAAVASVVTDWIPRVFYFDEYSQLPGAIEIERLLNALRTDSASELGSSQQTALSLLMMAAAGPEEMKSADYEVRSGELEAVSSELTQQVLQYWSQNPYLRLRLDVDRVAKQYPNGPTAVVDKLRLRVEDTRHYFTNSLAARSSGFRWFVSFLAAFSQFRDLDTPLIILLDEPGLSLHAKAQADLLRFINDELAVDHQVVYTTHSPFMVQTGALERVRLVEDVGPEKGAKVSGDVLSTDPETLFPLQGALGYDIAQNLSSAHTTSSSKASPTSLTSPSCRITSHSWAAAVSTRAGGSFRQAAVTRCRRSLLSSAAISMSLCSSTPPQTVTSGSTGWRLRGTCDQSAPSLRPP